MEPLPNRQASVAVDLGAQSCRVSLLRWPRGHATIESVNRFPNAPVETPAGWRWDLQRILEGVDRGLRAAAAVAPEDIARVAVDGWAVDYVSLNDRGEPVQDPFCYRDPRTESSARAVHAILPPARLYSLTGVQILRI